MNEHGELKGNILGLQIVVLGIMRSLVRNQTDRDFLEQTLRQLSEVIDQGAAPVTATQADSGMTLRSGADEVLSQVLSF